MRWTKHLTLAHADAALGLILEEFGAEGYGVYWLMVEDIAAPMELQKNIPDAIHSEVKWAQICHCSVRVWRSIAYRMQEKGLIEIESIANRRQITIPNILKYKDEYLKKSEGRGEKRAEREQRESRGENREKTPQAAAPEQTPELRSENHAAQPHEHPPEKTPEPPPEKPPTPLYVNGTLVAPPATPARAESPRGTRFHEAFLPAEWSTYCRDTLGWTQQMADDTFANFSDFWKAKAGKDGVKLDWVATWRIWCRNEDTGNRGRGFRRNGVGPVTDQKSTYKPLPVYLPPED
jgi:hypothetical protein